MSPTFHTREQETGAEVPEPQPVRRPRREPPAIGRSGQRARRLPLVPAEHPHDLGAHELEHVEPLFDVRCDEAESGPCSDHESRRPHEQRAPRDGVPEARRAVPRACRDHVAPDKCDLRDLRGVPAQLCDDASVVRVDHDAVRAVPCVRRTPRPSGRRRTARVARRTRRTRRARPHIGPTTRARPRPSRSRAAPSLGRRGASCRGASGPRASSAPRTCPTSTGRAAPESRRARRQCRGRARRRHRPPAPTERRALRRRSRAALRAGPRAPRRRVRATSSASTARRKRAPSSIPAGGAPIARARTMSPSAPISVVTSGCRCPCSRARSRSVRSRARNGWMDNQRRSSSARARVEA